MHLGHMEIWGPVPRKNDLFKITTVVLPITSESSISVDKTKREKQISLGFD